MTFTVLATDKVSTDGLAPLVEDDNFAVVQMNDSNDEEFDRILEKADALIVRSATKVTAELLARAPSLKVVGRAGVGVDNVDVAAASANGVAVFNAPGGNSNAAAEMTMALMLAMVRKVAQADRSVRSGSWDRAAFKGVELKGRTLGLIGAGRIGVIVGRRCHAFGMSVLCYDPYLSEAAVEGSGISLVSLDEVVDQSDIISCHVPLNDETRGLVNSALISHMKDGAYIVNVSRGGVVDEEALADALHREKIAGAALDVYEEEPLSERSPLRDAPNLTLTPHLGASSVEAQLGVATEVAAAIRVALADGDTTRALNSSDLA